MNEQKLAQLMESDRITIEQKWLYLVFLYEHTKGNHSFVIQDLVRHPNVMAPWSVVQRNMNQLERSGYIESWQDGETWVVSVKE